MSAHSLEMMWRLALDQLKIFENDLSNIKSDIKSVIDGAKPKVLMQAQQRASDIIMQIKNSEIFSKYLVHKELTRLRFRDAEKDSELLIDKTVRVISDVNTEEEKIMIRNRLDKISHLLVPESGVRKEIENLKLKHDEEINELKNQHKKEKSKYEKEKEDLLNHELKLSRSFKIIKD